MSCPSATDTHSRLISRRTNCSRVVGEGAAGGPPALRQRRRRRGAFCPRGGAASLQNFCPPEDLENLSGRDKNWTEQKPTDPAELIPCQRPLVAAHSRHPPPPTLTQEDWTPETPAWLRSHCEICSRLNFKCAAKRRRCSVRAARRKHAEGNDTTAWMLWSRNQDNKLDKLEVQIQPLATIASEIIFFSVLLSSRSCSAAKFLVNRLPQEKECRGS